MRKEHQYQDIVAFDIESPSNFKDAAVVFIMLVEGYFETASFVSAHVCALYDQNGEQINSLNDLKSGDNTAIGQFVDELHQMFDQNHLEWLEEMKQKAEENHG